MIDLLSIIGLPFRAHSKTGGRLVCAAKNTKWQRDQVPRTLLSLPSVVTKSLIFEEKKEVAYVSRKISGFTSDKNYARGTKQYCLSTKQQVTLKFND